MPMTQNPSQDVPEPAKGALGEPSPAMPGAATGGLRLVKLTLHGFKSFADKTSFTFDDDMTGVVGPNGCGKSNIVDAIKWVLGERSSKSLRGKEMIDVIFAGSAKRKPSGLACVTLTFDNPIVERVADIADKAHSEVGEDGEEASEASELFTPRGQVRRPLPIDTETVEVERRLYLDGKSQYLINGRIARLRDIRELFLDTGIGADAYSIIEQGKVDAMLLASPTERRTIFEEAAGVAKYRQRRAESQRKLERTEVNLTRTREQLASTDRRLRLVRGQAAKARRYQELKEESDALRLAVAFEQYDELRTRLDGLTSQLTKLESERDAARQSLTAAEQELQDAELNRQKLAGDVRQAEDERTAARHGAEQAEQRRELAAKATREAGEQAEADEARARAASEEAERVAADLTDEREKVAALAEALSEAERRAESASAARAEVLERVTTLRSSLDEARRRATGAERERSILIARIESDERRAEALVEQVGALTSRRAGFENDRRAALDSLHQTESSLKEHQARANAIRERLAAIETAESRLGSDRRELSQQVASLDERFARADARRGALEEMIKTRAGLADAARAVLEARDGERGFGGVVGSLAELIEADAEHAAAVEAALGDNLSAIVMRSVAAMPTREELASLPGRAVFTPILGLGSPPGVLDERLIAPLGHRVTPVLTLVRGRTDDMHPLLARLLGRTLLVEDLDAALMLAAGPLAGTSARFVTRAGEVLEPDGRVIAGPEGAESSRGVIARWSELTRLESQILELRGSLDIERSKLVAADAEAAQLETERARAMSELGPIERAIVTSESEGDRMRTELARCERELAGGADAIASLEQRLNAARGERADSQAQAERLGGLAKELEEEATDLEAKLSGASAEVEKVGEALTAERVAVSAATEQLGSARARAGHLEGQLDATERQRDEATRHAEFALRRVEEHREAEKRSTELASQHREDEERLSSQVEALAKDAQAANERTSAVTQRVRELQQASQHVERDWHSVETGRRELEIKRETLEERVAEDLELQLADEYMEYREMMAGGDVTRIDTGDAQARVNVLRAELNKLGPVNLNAIEEENELAERNEDLIAQVADIDEARIRLATLIEKLDIASRDRFGEIFEKIKGEFGGRDGMFRRLFGGGRAEIRLMPLVKEVDGRKVVTDEYDLLESGIEVIAKPPGKEPRAISQLSGGEKTLTAVALLMAIFRSKPSCFCVLDEVDAALDEANVGRFCNTIKQYTDQSHFIVITHNKRTMQEVGRLYGVTMQERGVSKRVSVRFDQVGPDGQIKRSAIDAEQDAHRDEHRGDTTTQGKGLRSALAKMREGQEQPASVDN